MFGSKRLQKRGTIKAEITFPNVKITIDGEEPVKGLKEINRVLHSIKAIEFNRQYVDVDDENVAWRLGYLSEELRENQAAVGFINEASKVEEGFRFKKFSLENTKIIDLNTGTHSIALSQTKLAKQTFAVCFGNEKSSFALIHVMGSLPEPEKMKIVEQFKNRLGKAKIKSVFTNKDVLGKTMVEAVFFGQFQEEDF